MTGFKTDISKQGTKFELVFYTDNKDYFKKVQSVARDCIDHKPITQFDRIKAMSVEELAETIKNTVEDCEKHCAFTKNGKCNSFGDVDVCAKGIELWLESEGQENENKENVL